MTSSRRHIAAWLGVVAIGLQGLWPAGSMPQPRAVDRLGGICTSDGFKPASRGQPAPRPSLPVHEHRQCVHCTPCTFSVAHGPPVSVGQPAARVHATGARIPPPEAGASSHLVSNPGARPRAPPVPLAVS